MPTHVNWNSGDGERGPGWFDVYDGLKRLRADSGCHVRLGIEPSGSVNGLWGLRAVVYLPNELTEVGACGYGRAYPNGAKTLAAACFQAVYRAECLLGSYEDIVSAGVVHQEAFALDEV